MGVESESESGSKEGKWSLEEKAESWEWIRRNRWCSSVVFGLVGYKKKIDKIDIYVILRLK